MAAHTITVDEETFEAAKAEADRRNTSVDQLVKEYLSTLHEPEQNADDASEQLKAFHALEALAKDHPFRVDPRSYTREELHERP